MKAINNAKKLPDKRIQLIGHFFCITWMLFCSWYYLERVVYIDTGNQVFQMVNSEWFSIFVQRYSMALHQLLPLGAIHLGAPLNTVIFLYSISFGLIMYAIFLVNAYIFKSSPAAMITILMPASLGHTFFHGISETVQLFAFSALLYGWFDYSIRRQRYHPFLPFVLISACILLLCFFIHPVSAFFVAFILGYLYFDYHLFKSWWIYGLAIFFGALLIAKLLLTSGASHDAGFFSELGAWQSIIPGIPKGYPVEFLRVHFWEFYAIPVVLLFVSTAVMVWRKFWIKAFFILGFVAVFMLITLIVYHKGDSDHGMERSFLPLAFFCGLPFLREVLFPEKPIFRNHYAVTIALLPAIAVWGFANISSAGQVFSKRLTELRYYLKQAEQSPGSKFYVSAGDLHLEPLAVHYLFSTETLMISALHGTENNQTIYIDHGELDTALVKQRDDLFLFTNYHLYRSEAELNPRYFHIRGKYQPLFAERDLAFRDFCGAEQLNPEREHMLTGSGIKVLLNAPRDSVHRYEGHYSIRTGAENEFGMEMTLPECQVGDQWRIQIRRLGHPEASLVVSDGKDLYVRAQHSETKDADGWETLELIFVVNSSVDLANLKLYVWNPSREPTWFDNLETSLWTLQSQR